MVDSASNRNKHQKNFWGVKAAGAKDWKPYHLHVPIVMKSGNLYLMESSGIAFTVHIQDQQWVILLVTKHVTENGNRWREKQDSADPGLKNSLTVQPV